MLQQNLELFDAYQHQLAACNAAIEAHVLTVAAQAPTPASPVPAARTRKTPRNNEPRFEIRRPLHRLTGVDLTQIDAIGPYSALRLLSEIGTEMSRWPADRETLHVLADPGAPQQNLWRPTAQLQDATVRQPRRCDPAHGRHEHRYRPRRILSPLGLPGRESQSHHGTTARKLAILVYRTLKDGLVYQDSGAAAYDAQHRVRILHRLRQRAAHFGFSLLNRDTGELLEGAVS